MPPPGTGVLSFGLVAIPVRIHTATHSENVSFHLLHEKCGSRVRNQHYCPVCNIVVERADLVRGFHHTPTINTVPVTEEEIESLAAEKLREAGYQLASRTEDRKSQAYSQSLLTPATFAQGAVSPHKNFLFEQAANLDRYKKNL